MAGFVMRDPRLNKYGLAKEAFNRAKHQEAIVDDAEGQGWNASMTPLMISDSRVAWLRSKGLITVTEKSGRLEGTADKAGVRFDYALMKEPGGLYTVCFDHEVGAGDRAEGPRGPPLGQAVRADVGHDQPARPRPAVEDAAPERDHRRLRPVRRLALRRELQRRRWRRRRAPAGHRARLQQRGRAPQRRDAGAQLHAGRPGHQARQHHQPHLHGVPAGELDRRPQRAVAQRRGRAAVPRRRRPAGDRVLPGGHALRHRDDRRLQDVHQGVQEGSHPRDAVERVGAGCDGGEAEPARGRYDRFVPADGVRIIVPDWYNR